MNEISTAYMLNRVASENIRFVKIQDILDIIKFLDRNEHKKFKNFSTEHVYKKMNLSSLKNDAKILYNHIIKNEYNKKYNNSKNKFIKIIYKRLSDQNRSREKRGIKSQYSTTSKKPRVGSPEPVNQPSPKRRQKKSLKL